MKTGTTIIETTMARIPLAIVSSPRVEPTFSSWSGSGLRLAGRLPDRRTVIRKSSSFWLNPSWPPSMIPDSLIGELIDGADWITPSRRMASWYLKLPFSSGRCSLVSVWNRRPPCRLNVKPTAGW